MSKDNFTDFSIDYSKKKSKKHRHDMGQYFTPKCIRELLMGKLPFMSGNPRILEPSCGSGEFIDSILEKYPSSEIVGVELDTELVKHCSEKYSEYMEDKKWPRVSILESDFLRSDFGENFDLIITNPPYFEVYEKAPNKKDTTHVDKELVSAYKSVGSGRMNIFTMFIKKSLDLLSDGGILSFVITGSILNGKFYEKIREYILKNAVIEDICIVPKSMSNKFIGTNMEVIIFTLKKYQNLPDSRKFVAKKHDITIFSTDWISIQKEWDDCSTIYLEDGSVQTGSVVWNVKEIKGDSDLGLEAKLTDEKDKGVLLVYADNIGRDGKLMMPTRKNKKKKQYVKYDSDLAPMTGPAVLVNRITGSRDNITLRPLMIEADTKFFAENHVNVIKGEPEMLQRVYQKMISKEADAFMKKVSGNTQVSKSELLHLLPI